MMIVCMWRAKCKVKEVTELMSDHYRKYHPELAPFTKDVPEPRAIPLDQSPRGVWKK